MSTLEKIISHKLTAWEARSGRDTAPVVEQLRSDLDAARSGAIELLRGHEQRHSHVTPEELRARLARRTEHYENKVENVAKNADDINVSNHTWALRELATVAAAYDATLGSVPDTGLGF